METTYTALVVAALLGTQPIIQKHLMGGITPYTYIAASGLTYAIVVVCYYLLAKDCLEMHLVQPHRVMWLVCYSLFLVFIPNILYAWCLSKASVLSITGILYLSPVITSFVNYMFLNKRLTRNGLYGLFMMVCGGLILNRSELKKNAST